jgi:xylitol oxidase
MNLKNLAGAVSELEMITGEGDLVRLSRERDGEQFFAAVVGLGALGVITKLKLDIEKSFEVRQFVFTDLSLSRVKEHFTEIMSSAYSVSLFTDWKSSLINEVWLKSRDNKDLKLLELDSFYGAAAAKENLHPIKGIPALNCTEQLGGSGPWHERLPHFKMGFMPSAGNELQSEYFIPSTNAADAISVIAGLAELIWPYLYVSEIRAIAADEFWMSPCYQQDSVAIHFTWKDNWEAVSQILPVIEKELFPLGGRPHWGKLFTMTSADIAPFYPKWEEFKKIADYYDPQKKFRNEFLNQYVFGI